MLVTLRSLRVNSRYQSAFMTSCKLSQKPDKIEVVTKKLKIIPLDTTQGIHTQGIIFSYQ